MENSLKRTALLVSKNQNIVEELKKEFSDVFDFLITENNDDALAALKSLKLKNASMIFVDITEIGTDIIGLVARKNREERFVNIPVVALTKNNRFDSEWFSNGVSDFINVPMDNPKMELNDVKRLLELCEQEKINVNENNTKTIIPAVKISKLFKSYGSKEVLKGLDLEVYNGELFGFIGRNGIGKSTTIDCMIGVKRFNSGLIELEGYSISDDPLNAKAQFGYVASEPTCYESMTGYEYLEFIASVYQISEAEFVGNVDYLAKRLVLTDEDLSKSIANYSHGMKQKLCLIASLLKNPDLWILDEPTVGLDIMAIEELKKMMREYANHGKCVFVTSHNIEIIAKICDRVAIINNGVIVELLDLNKNPNKRLQLPRIFLNIFGVEQ